MATSDRLADAMNAIRDAQLELQVCQTEAFVMRALVADMLPLVDAYRYECSGCKYERHTDCDCGNRCRLLIRAEALGITYKEMDD